MNNFIYYAPTKVYFGKGRENETGKICRESGYGRVFIVYGGNSAVRSGLIGRVEKSLEDAGILFDKMGGVVANPLLSRTLEIADCAGKFSPDLILAVGGGSVIDTAKVVAHSVANPELNVWDLFEKKAEISVSTPIAAILTIAAAGSEMSDSAVQTNDFLDPPIKTGINTVLNRCRFAIMNPELTQTLPKHQIGAGAADIWMHTAERYFTTSALTGNHMSDEIAEGLFRNIMKYGPIGVKNPDNYEAMSEIMWSSTISHNDITGLGINKEGGRGGDWACHQLGQTISALYDSTHGSSLSAIWASWARFCLDANVARFAQYGRNVLGYEGEDIAVAEEAISATEEWFKELEQPTSLTELLDIEVTDEVLNRLAMLCSRNKGRTLGQLKILGYEEMYEIYKMAR